MASPHTTAPATNAIDAKWPTAIGNRARKACARSRERRPQAAAQAQPLAGFSPCRAPTPATASQGQRLDMMLAPAWLLSGFRTAARIDFRRGRERRLGLVAIMVAHPVHLVE